MQVVNLLSVQNYPWYIAHIPWKPEYNVNTLPSGKKCSYMWKWMETDVCFLYNISFYVSLQRVYEAWSLQNKSISKHLSVKYCHFTTDLSRSHNFSKVFALVRLHSSWRQYTRVKLLKAWCIALEKFPGILCDHVIPQNKHCLLLYKAWLCHHGYAPPARPCFCRQQSETTPTSFWGRTHVSTAGWLTPVTHTTEKWQRLKDKTSA